MIGPVELEQVALLLGPRREQHRLDCLGPGQERAGVPPPGQVLFPGLGEACRGILANRLMEAERAPAEGLPPYGRCCPRAPAHRARPARSPRPWRPGPETASPPPSQPDR